MLKKVLSWIVVGFLVFYLWSQPEDAAASVRGIFDFVIEVFTSIVTFFSALATG